MQTFRQLRDGFVWYVPQDAFNTERIEVSRGPAGLAYGDVDTGGIINVGTKRAHHRDAYGTQVRYDTFGTRRYSIDLNEEILPRTVAFRLNAMLFFVAPFGAIAAASRRFATHPLTGWVALGATVGWWIVRNLLQA